jgi:hypothetical protein
MIFVPGASSSWWLSTLPFFGANVIFFCITDVQVNDIGRDKLNSLG